MPGQALPDYSNGYEKLAEEYARRCNPTIGVASVRAWSRTLPRGAAVLDLGCGNGVPIAGTLAAEGFELYGMDASPSMIAAFRQRFPNAHAECSPVEHSAFFHRRFDGIMAWGLVFLLSPAVQETVIRKAAQALNPGGKFLFTAPKNALTWIDVMTRRESISLGRDAYYRLLEHERLVIDGEDSDEGENYYYLASRPAASG